MTEQPAHPPLAVGTPVTVIRATYSAVPASTVATIERVRVNHGERAGHGRGVHLYRVAGFNFWPWELTWEGKGQ